MEFPNLGQHCSVKSCNKLDFLPMQCDGCRNIFCSIHFHYEHHKCKSNKQKDFQVPLCPLCDEPVPTPPNVSPDVTVSEHIDRQCKSETKKIFTNRCSYNNCKRKELIPVQCKQCKRNYCLRHRHTTDHECHGKQLSQEQKKQQQLFQLRTNAANAAELRRKQKFASTNTVNGKINTINKTTTTTTIAAAATTIPQYYYNRQNGGGGLTDLQGNLSEDEALAQAIALSIMDLDQHSHSQRIQQLDTNTASNSLNTNATATIASIFDQDHPNSANNKNKCSLS